MISVPTVCVLLIAVFSAASTAASCPGTVATDLVFAIDSSGTLGNDDYKRNFEFVINSVRGFTLGPNAVRVALITFGCIPQVIFPFTDDISLIEQKLLNVPYKGKTTNTHLALNKALELLSVGNGGRNGVKQTVIVVTDSPSKEPNNTLVAALALKLVQVLVITVGVTSQANVTELTAVATKPEYFFQVPSYSDLASFADPVTTLVCDKPIPPPAVKPCPPAKVVDIVFVVDSSGSVGAANYHYNFEFIQTIIDAYYLAENGAKVAMFIFSTSVSPRFELSADRAFITAGLKNVPYLDSGTSTHLALNYVVDNGLFTPQHGARNGRHVLVLITDGQSNYPQDTLAAASRVKAAGIEIITVGVGSGLDQNELNAVASKPEYAITTQNYSLLEYIASKTSDRVCEDQSGGR